MKILCTVASVVMLLLGLSWLLFPQSTLASWGLGSEAGMVFIARRYGAMGLGYAVILWLARNAERSPARSAILLGNAVANTAIALVSLTGVMTQTVGPAAWSAVVVEGLLALAFAFYWIIAR
jgi:hypothetical protein